MGLNDPALEGGPVLETARLTLRPVKPADLEASFRLWSDPEVTRFITGAPLSREECWARILRHLRHWAALGFGYWSIFENRSETHIGEMGLADFQRDITPSLAGTLEMGWVLAPTAQGRGFAHEALLAIMAWASITHPAKPLTSMITKDNKRSIVLAEKLGFSFWTEAMHRHTPVQLYRRDV
jgi:RimJ/RimL family protein N-acetyltransferase